MGYQAARKLLTVGATVHIIDLQPLAKNHPPYPTTGKFYTHIGVDLGSREQVHKAFVDILKISPSIYGVVAAAGSAPCDDEGRMIESDSVLAKTFATNTFGTYHAVTELLKHVREKTKPYAPDERVAETKHAIVTLGSSAALVGFPQCCVYTGAKHAVLGFTRTWAIDWAHYGVRSNMVAPGATNTPLAMAQMDGDGHDGDTKVYGTKQDRGDIMDMARLKVPMKRWGEADELGDAIIFLLSEKSSFVTGQVIPVNGGWP